MGGESSPPIYFMKLLVNNLKHVVPRRNLLNVDYFYELDVVDLKDTEIEYYDIYVTYFDAKPLMKRFLRVLKHSVEKNAPKANLIVDYRQKSELQDKHKSWYNNNLLKARAWMEYAQTIERPTVFMDVDTLVLSDLAQGFQGELTITRRTGTRSWFNSGVVFAMPTDRVKGLFKRWYDKAFFLYNNPTKLKQAASLHVGIHQTSFIHLLNEGEVDGIDLKVLNGDEWNSTRNCWNNFSDHTKVLHVTARLKDEVFSKTKVRIFHKAVEAYRRWLDEAEKEE